MDIIGKERAIDFFMKTKKIEEGGGMLIMNGSRRRTAGGVYFWLVKNDEHIPQEKIREIFYYDQKETSEQRKKNDSARSQKAQERMMIGFESKYIGTPLSCNVHVVWKIILDVNFLLRQKVLIYLLCRIYRWIRQRSTGFTNESRTLDERNRGASEATARRGYGENAGRFRSHGIKSTAQPRNGRSRSL